MTKIYFSLLLVFMLQTINGQDPVFTQYYAAPVKNNPAFTGLTEAPLVNLNYRNQWPAFDKAYVTYNVGFTQFFDNLHSGFGLSIQADNAGQGLYRTTEVKGLYSYQLEPSKDIFLKLGVDVGATSNAIGWEQLLFPDDIDPFLGPSTHSSETIDPSSKTYLDIGAGGLLYNKHFYLGYAMAHINRPDNQFLEVSNKLYEGLPIRYSVQAGGQILLGKQTSHSGHYYLAPSIGWFKQSNFIQFDMDVFMGFGKFFAGGGYRNTISNGDALKVGLGFAEDIFKIAYSYDYTLSDLSNASAGSHEISFILNFDKSDDAKRRRQNARYQDCFNLFR